MNLEIREFASAVGVLMDTVINWELRSTVPSLPECKRMKDFLMASELELSEINQLFDFYLSAHPQYPKNVETFGDKLRATRIKKFMLIRELAKELNVDPTSIQRWETNRCEPMPKLKNRVLAWINKVK